MAASKLVDPDEFIRWYGEGKTYSWIMDEYRRKYGLQIGSGTISNWRHQLGIKKRAVRDSRLIPWAVRPEHRCHHVLQMLRTEARHRGGQPVAPDRLRKLRYWLDNLAAQDAVVHYEPETSQGWWLVPRRPGVDADLIREPGVVTRSRGSRS
ncbi:hypothetical protein ACFW0V_21760 [Micromonospora parva]|uniref:hypothetical protein n=1 Tax=Micromonospora parva TaxID=1464048 RepID=UPI00366BD337